MTDKFTHIPAAYEIVSLEYIDEIKSQAALLRHRKTGARIAVLANDDENKTFNIGFRTPPKDSTGVAHIMEHSVLCGSEKFPAKDPFVELAKGSLNTFLNAMTYPDKTVYPIASCNDADFQNLMHVYLDAVFHPNIYIHDEIFRQEGWHYELTDKDAPLIYNGVVYNEMKGAFSAPEQILYRKITDTLFPDTIYSVESGGDPDVIPQLTYAQFLDFHRKYYHPSNSYIYLYGNMDVAEKLAFIDEAYLCQFDNTRVDSAIAKQAPFAHTSVTRGEYPIGNDDREDNAAYMAYSWVVGDSLDAKLCLGFQILEYALMEAPGAPLKQALLDKGFGEDIYGMFETSLIQPYLSIIIKNINEEDRDEIVQVIQTELEKLADGGLNHKTLEGALNYYEFKSREGDFGRWPKGLMYGLQLMDSWLYDENEPFMHIQALDTFAFLKTQMDTGYFENLIRKYLLDNEHGVIVTLKPERGRTAHMDKELHDKLQAYKAGLSKEEITELVERTKALEVYQSEPSDAEALATIPVLKREDISREIAPIYNEEMKLAGIPMVFHEIDTNGIGYIDIMFDMSEVPEELLPYAGILQGVLGIIDTENYEYGELFNEINVHTGGIGTSLELYTDVTKAKEKEFRATFEIKAKALYEKLPIAFNMMQEILVRSKLDDEKRLKEIIAMTASRLLMRFQSSGHTTAALRAMSYASPSAKLKDMTSGIEYYQNVARIEKAFDTEKDELIANLIKLTRMLFRADNMMISYTAERVGLEGMKQQISAFAEGLYLQEKANGEPCKLHCEKKNEGFKTASKVQYVARCGNFIDQGAEYTGALQVLKVIMGYEYLWQNIRVKGGAYGCMSNFNRVGEGYFVSYRDPNLERTMEIYEGVADYLRTFTVSDFDMNKYIIGTISNLDQPMTPALKGDRSMNLYMNHVTEEMIKEERAQVLEATQEDIRGLAGIVEAMMKADQICVIGSEDKIEEAKDMFDTVTGF